MSVEQELKDIKARSPDGLLRAEDVVAYAHQHRDSALHARFEWSDEKAAHEYRLWQARTIIRAHVTILPRDDRPIRAYISLPTDREREGGGYRGVQEVLESPDWRAEAVATALMEHERWEARYKHLNELATIFAAAKTARAKLARTNKTKPQPPLRPGATA